MSELLACPWCGSEAMVNHGDASYWVDACCPGFCPVQPKTEWYATEAEAIAAWNKRPAEDALRADSQDEIVAIDGIAADVLATVQRRREIEAIVRRMLAYLSTPHPPKGLYFNQFLDELRAVLGV